MFDEQQEVNRVTDGMGLYRVSNPWTGMVWHGYDDGFGTITPVYSVQPIIEFIQQEH